MILKEVNFLGQSHHVEAFKSLKVEITLKLFARDWSLEGAEEREQCYSPIIDAITEAFNPDDL